MYLELEIFKNLFIFIFTFFNFLNNPSHIQILNDGLKRRFHCS